jgi:hypothetical protein
MIRPTRQKWRRWLIGTWSWKRPLKSLAFIYGCLFLVAVFFTEKLLFFPPSPSYEETSEIIKLKTKSGNTIAAIDRPSKAGFPTLLYTHGNAEDLGDVFGMADAWQNEGFGVMAYDFPGYGRSSGTPLESTCEEAIEAAWSHLTISKGIAPSRIIIVGRSVGSGPSVWLAERKSPAGLILISPFTSVFAVRIPVPIFPYDRFPSLKRIPQVKCPLLVIHGEEDTLIPTSHGRRLVDAAKVADKKFLGIPDAGHNDLFEVGAGAIELAIRDFVLRVSPPQPAAGN